MPGTALNNLHELIHFKFKITLLSVCYHYPHFTDERTEVKKLAQCK